MIFLQRHVVVVVATTYTTRFGAEHVVIEMAAPVVVIERSGFFSRDMIHATPISNSNQIKNNCRLILEVENQTIKKKAEIWSSAYDSHDYLGSLRYTGEWEGQELEVNFQHLGNGYLNVGVYHGGVRKLLLVCKACNETPMMITTDLNDKETLIIQSTSQFK